MTTHTSDGQNGTYVPSIASFYQLVEKELGNAKQAEELWKQNPEVVEAARDRIAETDPVLGKLRRYNDSVLRAAHLIVGVTEYHRYQREDRILEFLAAMSEGTMTEDTYQQILNEDIVLIRRTGIPRFNRETDESYQFMVETAVAMDGTPLYEVRKWLVDENEKPLERIVISECR